MLQKAFGDLTRKMFISGTKTSKKAEKLNLTSVLTIGKNVGISKCIISGGDYFEGDEID